MSTNAIGDDGEGSAAGPSAAPFGKLFESVYDELRRLAAARLFSERPDHTLQPTALVHEAYMRLAVQDASRLTDRHHLIVIAAIMMRRILVDHGRRRSRRPRGASGRGGDADGPEEIASRVESMVSHALESKSVVPLEELDAMLERIGARHRRWREVAELRFFAGLSVEETASALAISPRQVELDWRASKACLRAMIESKGAEGLDTSASQVPTSRSQSHPRSASR